MLIGGLIGLAVGEVFGMVMMALISCGSKDDKVSAPQELPELKNASDSLISALNALKDLSELPEGITIYDSAKFIKDGQVDDIIKILEFYSTCTK
jgi:hypothetical protein